MSDKFMELNLPHYDYKLRRDNDGVKIFDRLRMKYVAVTPEEWVRQHFIEYLIAEKGYPPTLMANEVGITLNGTRRRCDSIVVDHSGKVVVIIEYKSPEVTVSQTTFDQIVRYNMVLRARYLIVSNGLNHYCCAIDYETGTYRFLPDIPHYESL